jgi:hypothetical protein
MPSYLEPDGRVVHEFHRRPKLAPSICDLTGGCRPSCDCVHTEKRSRDGEWVAWHVSVDPGTGIPVTYAALDEDGMGPRIIDVEQSAAAVLGPPTRRRRRARA